jgi:hypothetical protein
MVATELPKHQLNQLKAKLRTIYHFKQINKMKLQIIFIEQTYNMQWQKD